MCSELQSIQIILNAAGQKSIFSGLPISTKVLSVTNQLSVDENQPPRMVESAIKVNFTSPKVLTVTLYNPETFPDFSIDRHYPDVERLAIKIAGNFTLSEHLPHLEHFELIDKSCGHFDLKTFAQFNPRVRSVRLDLCEGLDSLQEVNELFPELVSLYYKPKNGTHRNPDKNRNVVRVVRFKNVKDFSVDLSDYKQEPLNPTIYADMIAKLSSIEFDRLDSLAFITSESVSSSSQRDYVPQHKEVTRLDYSSSEVAHADVKRLVDALPSLKEITIRPNYYIECLYLMTDTSLETIHLLVRSELADNFRVLTLPDQWTLQPAKHSFPNNFERLTFKRM